jgi:hypothetical protein
VAIQATSPMVAPNCLWMSGMAMLTTLPSSADMKLPIPTTARTAHREPPAIVPGPVAEPPAAASALCFKLAPGYSVMWVST